jgi:hypothetical protein
LRAESGIGRILERAFWAPPLEWSSALYAEFCAFGIFGFTARAAHSTPQPATDSKRYVPRSVLPRYLGQVRAETLSLETCTERHQRTVERGCYFKWRGAEFVLRVCKWFTSRWNVDVLLSGGEILFVGARADVFPQNIIIAIGTITQANGNEGRISFGYGDNNSIINSQASNNMGIGIDFGFKPEQHDHQQAGRTVTAIAG